MKIFHKFTSIILCLSLILFFSTSFAFGVDWSTTDQSNLSNIASRLTYGSYSAAGWLSRIYGTLAGTNGSAIDYLSTISSKLQYQQSIYNTLSTMATNVVSIKNALTANSGNSLGNILENIYNEFISTSAGGTVTHYIQRIFNYNANISNNVASISSLASDLTNEVLTDLPLIKTGVDDLNTKTSNIYTLENNTLPGIYAYSGSIDSTATSIYDLQFAQLPKLEDLKIGLTNKYYGQSALSVLERKMNAHYALLNSSGEYTTYTFYGNTLQTGTNNWNDGSPLGNIAVLLDRVMRSTAYMGYYMLNGSYNTQTFTNWKTLQSETFTPVSLATGLYSWASNIQNPIARLASVHASDEEIAAREKAAANQTAVVNNFIDPNGSGSLPTSSIGSVSDISDSFKDNFSTDASPAGLFDIFNSDHGSWFSQETADQLDTTNVSTRFLKTTPSNDFETPLLNQQIDEIYNALGVKK